MTGHTIHKENLISVHSYTDEITNKTVTSIIIRIKLCLISNGFFY